MDAIDNRLIAALRHNARRSISDLAQELDVSRATIRARLGRLERSGDIQGYTVVTRADADGDAIRSITLIEIEGHATDRIVKVLSGYPEVGAIHKTNGRWDLVMELFTPSLAEFDAILGRIRLIPGISSTETSLLLTSPKPGRARLPT